jgi:hypothetical protein
MRIDDMFEARRMFAVFLRRKDGSEFIASAAGSAAGLYHRRTAAKPHRAELAAHKLRGVIRPVTVTIRPEK